MSTVDAAQPSAEHHENRLEFETLISDLSSRFINLRPGEVDREIEDALRRDERAFQPKAERLCARGASSAISAHGLIFAKVFASAAFATSVS